MRKLAFLVSALVLSLQTAGAVTLSAEDYLRLSLQKLKEARLYAEKSLKAGKVEGFNYQLYIGYLDRTIDNLEKVLKKKERTYDDYYRLKIDSDLLLKDIGEKK
jgi:proline dehydrogenase